MKELFEHTLKDKLQDFSMKTEPADWIRIERSLGLEMPKRVPLFRYVALAAAMLVLGVLGFYMAQNTSSDPQDIGHMSSITTETANPIGNVPENQIINDPAVAAKDNFIAVVNGLNKQAFTSRTAQDKSTVQNIPVTDPQQENNTRVDISEQPANQTQSIVRTGQNANSNSPYNFIPDNRLLKTRRNSPGKNWSLALYADGSAAKNGNNSVRMNHLANFSNAASLEDFAMIKQADNQLVQLKVEETSGTYTAEIPEWDHELPLSFGFMLRHNLTDRLGVEVGITYSYLSSKQKASSTSRKQQLHYLGVPVAVVYTPFRINNFDIYARGAGAADFNIAGRVKTTYDTGSSTNYKFTNSNVQWSITGNIGVMYNITDHLGVYLEPGVNHYFTFSHQPESYWKENPTSFNLKLGVRTTF